MTTPAICIAAIFRRGLSLISRVRQIPRVYMPQHDDEDFSFFGALVDKKIRFATLISIIPFINALRFTADSLSRMSYLARLMMIYRHYRIASYGATN